jgi:hypothetical protein
MEGYPFDQSAIKRAFEDTKKSVYFKWVVTGVVMSVFGVLGPFLAPEGASKPLLAAYAVIGVGVGFGGGFVIVYMLMLIKAPFKQRNEARAKVIGLEKEKEPCIEVHPLPCKGGFYELGGQGASAVLKVRNSSCGVDLENVSVQILELAQVTEVQDGQGIGTGRYEVYKPYPRWSPANVYWAESNAPPNQFEIPIPRGATRVALIAFHPAKARALGFLNTPTKPVMLECRIVIEVSSPSMSTWQGSYYIAYHPPLRDEFEFIEWDLWRKSHNVNISEE